MRTTLNSSEIISYIIKKYAERRNSIQLSIDEIYQIAQEVEVISPSIYVEFNRRSLESFELKSQKHIRLSSQEIVINLNNEEIQEIVKTNQPLPYHAVILAQATNKHLKDNVFCDFQ